tara:strand:+ start:141 stop:461 length:321 start_codon:yes stop_codon:yes gene_type:complete
MFLSSTGSYFLYNRAKCFSTIKLHELDQYWSNCKSHAIHQEIHEMIESILINRGEKTLRQKRLDVIKHLDKSLSISNPSGRLSANIIAIVNKFLFSLDLLGNGEYF